MMFKLASTLLPAVLLTGLAAAQVNDECSGALVANVGSTTFDNFGATTSAPAFSCEPTFGQADIWFSFTAPATGPFEIETCGSTFDTVLEVLSGPCNALVVENCNDDGCGTQSSLLLSATGGTTYSIRVGGWNGANGSGTLQITAGTAVPNDDCVTATPATPGFGLTNWTNVNAATSSPPFTCEAAGGQADVWFSWTAPSTGPVVFETCGSTLADTVLEVFEGSCAGSVVACNDDGCTPFQSRTSAIVTSGTNYLIRIGGFNGASGDGILTTSVGTVANDDCGGALPAMLGMTAFDNTGASTSSPGFVCEPVQGQSDIWFNFNAPVSTDYTIETCGSSLGDSVLEVWEGTCAGAVVGCNDDFCTLASSVTISATAGMDYKIRVGGWGGAEGTGFVTISESTAPPLDLVAHYRLDETSGSTAADSSSNGNDGFYTNAQLGQMGADPATGNSARFDGTATVDISATPELDALRTRCSATAWVNVDAPVAGTYRIFSNSGPGGSWSFAITPNGLAFTTHAILDYGTTATITPGTWHHVGVVLDATNDVSFYLDGQLLSTETGSSAANTPSTEYHIGAWNPNFTIPQFFVGRIDDVQVYTGELSAAQMMTQFMNPGTTFGDDAIGSSYCMANANSTGATGEISANGSVDVSANDVTLTVADLPTQAFGFFIVARNQGFVPNPNGSEGNLCLSGAIGRYVGAGQIKQTNNQGTFSLAIDLGMIPSPVGFVSAVSGDRFNFQAWHRDSVNGAATSNFTNGVAIDFQ